MPSSMRHRRRLWQACLPVGFLLGLIPSAAAEDRQASPAEGPSAPGIEARIDDDGRLTLRADGAPLAEVLRAVGAAGKFPVVLRGAFAAPVRDSFAAQPIERAVRRLAEGHSLVISYGEAPPGETARTIAEVRVIEQGGQATAGDPAPAAAAAPAGEEGDAASGGQAMDREEFRRQAAADRARPRTIDDVRLELLLPDQEARLAAVPKVGSLRPNEAAQVLSEVFDAETDPLVRSRAIAAATRLNGLPGTMLLRQRALAEDDPELRMQALNALAASGDGRVAAVLGRALGQDPEPRVRQTAIEALRRVGGERARGYVERAAADPEVGAAAERALAGWAEERGD